MLVDVQERGAFRPIGTTLDDAAGEAFDKGARLLGLGYPGGAELDRLAGEGDPEAYDFPVARVPGLDFSFSGVKTALLYEVRKGELEARRADLAASYQRAIVQALARRTLEAAEQTGAERIAIVGGVAANSELRTALADATAPPLRALHRQRRDDRFRGPLCRGDPLARLSWARCLFLGCLRQDAPRRPRSSRWRRRCSWSASGSAAPSSARSSPGLVVARARRRRPPEGRRRPARARRSARALDGAAGRDERRGRNPGRGAEVDAARAPDPAAAPLRAQRARDPAARRVQLQARVERVLGAARRARDRGAREPARSRGRLPGARRLSGLGLVGAARQEGSRPRRRAPARGDAAGLRRARRHDRAARHGRRPRPAAPARPGAARDRHRRRPRRHARRGRPGRLGPGRAPRHRDGRDPRRRRRPGRDQRRRDRRRRCCRSASPAGSTTSKAAGRSTRAPIS